MTDRKDYWKEYNAARAEKRREYERERYRKLRAGDLKPPAPAGICAVCGQPLVPPPRWMLFTWKSPRSIDPFSLSSLTLAF